MTDSLDKNLANSVERHLRMFFANHQDPHKIDNLYQMVQQEVDRPLIQLALEMHGGNQTKAAALLGLNRNTLRKKIRDLELPTPR